jgi:hypothetical protein
VSFVRGGDEHTHWDLEARERIGATGCSERDDRVRYSLRFDCVLKSPWSRGLHSSDVGSAVMIVFVGSTCRIPVPTTLMASKAQRSGYSVSIGPYFG